jgi:hypothetical protein
MLANRRDRGGRRPSIVKPHHRAGGDRRIKWLRMKNHYGLSGKQE